MPANEKGLDSCVYVWVRVWVLGLLAGWTFAWALHWRWPGWLPSWLAEYFGLVAGLFPLMVLPASPQPTHPQTKPHDHKSMDRQAICSNLWVASRHDFLSESCAGFVTVRGASMLNQHRKERPVL
jgi:hypothetical protein